MRSIVLSTTSMNTVCSRGQSRKCHGFGQLNHSKSILYCRNDATWYTKFANSGLAKKVRRSWSGVRRQGVSQSIVILRYREGSAEARKALQVFENLDRSSSERYLRISSQQSCGSRLNGLAKYDIDSTGKHQWCVDDLDTRWMADEKQIVWWIVGGRRRLSITCHTLDDKIILLKRSRNMISYLYKITYAKWFV